MIPDIFQYFLDHLWNFQKCDQIWILRPVIHYRNILKTPETMETVYTRISCVNADIQQFKKQIEMSCVIFFEIKIKGESTM